MAERGDPRVLRFVALYLRHHAEMEQEEFGQTCGVDQSNLSRYERGKMAPMEETLRRMAAVSKVPWYVVVSLIRFYTAVVAAVDSGLAPVSEPDLPPIEAADCAPLDMALAAYRLEEAVAAAEGPAPAAARREAAEVCAALLPYPPAERERLLGFSIRASRSWALAEALAHASELPATAHEVAQAQALVELALWVARRVPGEGRRARIEGYCTGFLANVRLAAAELDAASEGFARTWELWQAGRAAASLPLAEWRLLALEAALRREQHRFPEALERLDRALTLCGDQPEAAGRILLAKQQVLQQMGDLR